MKQSLLLAIIALFLCFCQSETTVPEHIIDQGEMRDILVDVHIAEGALKSNFILGDSAKQIAPALYEVIYRKYGITKTDFEQSLDWYIAHPEIMEEVNRRVVEELLLLETGK